MSDDRPLILVTNDDGVRAPGLAALAEALAELGEVWVFAPDRQQSAVSHSVSLHRPLRLHEVGERWFMVDGTPVDCVMLAIRDRLPRRPVLVVSGVNNGANLGDDVTYSGTVAGAYEGMLLGIPAIAVSDVSYTPEHFDTAAQFAAKLGRNVIERGLPADTVLNVNVPDLPYDQLQGVSHTFLGRRHYEDAIISRVDPRGQTYYWIGGTLPDHEPEPGTDVEAIAQGRVSVTPLHRDLTNYESLRQFAEWHLTL
jgi:5'-nucleotidase